MNDVEKAKSRMPKYQEYYADLARKYNGIKTLEIQGKRKSKENGSKERYTMTFYHDISDIGNRDTLLNFFSADPERINYYEDLEAARTNGEVFKGEELKRVNRSWIQIDKREKTFRFLIIENDARKGFGEYIYYHAQEILKSLGIEDAAEYTIVPGANERTAESFLNYLTFKEVVQGKTIPSDKEKGEGIMRILSNYSQTLSFSGFNNLIRYAKSSGVADNYIVKAINSNGFNISHFDWSYETVLPKEEVAEFQSFKIPGIRPTALHQRFISSESFEFMKLIGDTDLKDVAMEFKAIMEYVKSCNSNRITNNTNSRHVLKDCGELAAIIVSWPCLSHMVKKLDKPSKQLVKKSAVKVFERLDLDHKDPWDKGYIDSETKKVLLLLHDTGLMTSETIEGLYRGALDRNYDLDAFYQMMNYPNFADRDVLEAAKKQIENNRDRYYPTPREEGHTVLSTKPNYHIQSIEIPKTILSKYDNDKDKIQEALRQEIMDDKRALSTYIRCSDGAYIHLEKWMLGSERKKGFMHITDGLIWFPPQTPKFPLELVKDSFKKMEDPNYGGRGEI